ncbi:hypothetical protein BJY01DRAFT_257886 [Aspergillus pseudoustus]|uniref:Rhodopsin domain-containing protein n=1 Tax=Aspergillus pseudoustus TaxID=1810923 RepID=A0ABR4JG38_9EURO
MAGGKTETIITVTTFCVALSLITVCLRCYVRLWVVRAFGWDDGLMVAAMGFNVGFVLCGFIGASYGMGQKLSYFLPDRLDEFRSAMLCWWLGRSFYIITVMLAKISIALMLLRITITRVHVWILYAIMSLSIIVGVLFFFFMVFECHPVDYFWNRFRMSGKCLDTNIAVGIVYVYSVGAALSDLAIGILPVFLIWSLQMNKRSKIAVAGILGIGCVAIIAVIVRIPYLHDYKNPDFLYGTVDIAIWSGVEAGLGITAGSLTTLRPLVRGFRAASRSSRNHVGTHQLEFIQLSSMERLPEITMITMHTRHQNPRGSAEEHVEALSFV